MKTCITRWYIYYKITHFSALFARAARRSRTFDLKILNNLEICRMSLIGLHCLQGRKGECNVFNSINTVRLQGKIFRIRIRVLLKKISL